MRHAIEDPMIDPYPLTTEPILKAKVWGGQRLQSYGKQLPGASRVGESWEVADLDATSPSGGGGGAAQSVVTTGPLSGRTLRHALELWGADLVGEQLQGATRFPLLVKLIDAAEHLSVQVHPTPEYARHHAGVHVKTESWLVIEAAPDAVLYLGVRPGVHGADLRHAVEHGRVPEILRAVPAVVGECHHLPSGTIHALGAGVVVAEVQSPSDTTFRLYDWTDEYGREPRELHVDAALESAHFDPAPPPTRVPAGHGMADLVTTHHYVLRSARGLRSVGLVPATCAVVMCVDGSIALHHGPHSIVLDKGATGIVPAAIAADTQLGTSDGDALIAELAT